MNLWIDYKDLTIGDAFSRLFVDYVTNYPAVSSFYSGNFREASDWQRTLTAVTSRSMNRSSLVNILHDQNRNFQCGVKTLANIDLLLNDNAVAVVTGQQLGLLTGPLYTTYKMLTTLRLAEDLSARFPDYQFVPVFWLEGEDHDIEEVSEVTVFNAANDLTSLHYEAAPKAIGRNIGAVGQIPFNESVGALCDQLRSSLLPTEFTDSVFAIVRAACQPGMTFTKAFVYLWNVLLENSGLVFIDPHDTRFKKILTPLFERELMGGGRTSQLVIAQSEALENQYHAQVKPRSINLFLFHGGGRYPIEPHPDGYALKGTRQHFSVLQLQELLLQAPEAFSPNVVLRPLAQDTLLPTVAYVAGPSEIAYFAQLRPIYQELGIPEPILYPRASATVVEDRVDKVLERFSLDFADFLQDIEFTKQRVAERLSNIRVDDAFASAQGELEAGFTRLRPILQSIDPTLQGPLDHALNKSVTGLSLLKEKAVAAQKRQHEISLRQIERASAALFPAGSLQERKLNIVYFLNKYGLEFIRWLQGELLIDRFRHQIIHL